MLALIIAIGDELTSGQRLDTNSQWLSQQLGDLGITTVAHQTIADYRQPMIQSFQEAARQADVVIVTGGLGPTADDLTREAMAEAFGVDLKFDPPSWDHIQELFRRRNYKLPESNRVQAMFPAGSQVIPNPNGTAPGIDWEVSSPAGPPLDPRLEKAKTTCRFFCLPGVPAEMKDMFHLTVVPRIREWQGGQSTFIKRKVIRTFGAGESHVESILPDLVKRGNDPQVGITASKATISLRVEAQGESPEACDAKIEPVVQIIRSTLGDLVFGEGDEELEDAVIPLLYQQQKRLVVVEWGTSGLVSQWLKKALDRQKDSQVQDGYYAGSVILTEADAVTRWLEPDVTRDARELNNDPEQWESCVRDLSTVAARRFQADLAIACGPLPRNPQESECGWAFKLVAIDAANSGTEYVRSYHVVGHTSIWQPRAAKQVLNLLRLILMNRAEPTA